MNHDIHMLRESVLITEPSHISVTQMTYEKTCPFHWHDYYTIDLVLGGESIHTLNGVPRPIRSGDLYLVRPTDIHAIDFHRGTPLSLYTVRISEKAIPERFYNAVHGDSVMIHPSEKERRRILFYMQAIDDDNKALAEEKKKEPLLQAIALHLELLFLLIFSNESEIRRIGNFDTIENYEQKIFVQAMKYLDNNFLKNPSVAEIAAYVGLSPGYFSSFFKKVSGCSYVEYLTHRRLSYACALLANNASVSEACFSSGFGSLSNFTRVFRSNIGVAPGKYKKGQ